MRSVLKFFILFTLALCSLRAELTTIGYAEVFKAEGRFQIYFTIYIRNAEKNPVRIATGGFSQYSAATAASLTSNIEWDFINAPDKSRLILPESELKIVGLEPGESAILKWSKSEITAEHLSNVNVHILVKREFATRYGIWCGELKLDNIPVFRRS